MQGRMERLSIKRSNSRNALVAFNLVFDVLAACTGEKRAVRNIFMFPDSMYIPWVKEYVQCVGCLAFNVFLGQTEYVKTFRVGVICVRLEFALPGNWLVVHFLSCGNSLGWRGLNLRLISVKSRQLRA